MGRNEREQQQQLAALAQNSTSNKFAHAGLLLQLLSTANTAEIIKANVKNGPFLSDLCYAKYLFDGEIVNLLDDFSLHCNGGSDGASLGFIMRARLVSYLAAQIFEMQSAFFHYTGSN